MLFEFKGIEVLGRCLDDAVELALDSVRNWKKSIILSKLLHKLININQ